ncbi:hypothetical protein KJ605_02820, partial [Patescibacteria group bacterium]|nr:hypothetical protein [Patescibacteria group bacterium]
MEKLQVRKITGLYTNPQRLLSPLLYLYKEFSKKNTSEKLLISLFFILPWNLGKHFEIPSSYINGILIPYLIPTLYFQDILLVGIIFSNLVKSRLSFFNHAFNRLFIVRIFVLFMFACLLSIFFSSRSFPSWYLFGRFLLVFVFMLSSAKLFATSFIRRAFFLAIIVNLLLVCLLGVVQFARQSSVFHNYLFFGEQPYSGFTPFIAKESYQGVAKIPPYSVFMHPNILAGFVV